MLAEKKGESITRAMMEDALPAVAAITWAVESWTVEPEDIVHVLVTDATGIGIEKLLYYFNSGRF